MCIPKKSILNWKRKILDTKKYRRYKQYFENENNKKSTEYPKKMLTTF